jgi:hypothetical protein
MAVTAASGACARAVNMPLPEKVRQSTVIARVRVLSTQQSLPDEHYKSVARLRILEAVKGTRAGQELELAFDNGFACPNVLYKEGEECLVFAGKRSDGRYETVNAYNGKYLIKEARVPYWKPRVAESTLWSKVVAEIKRSANP